MKKRKNMKLIISILVFIAIITSLNIVNAASIVGAMNNSLNNNANPTQDSSIVYLLSRVFTTIQFIGTGIALIVIARLGITYMLTSVEEKAQIKQRAVPIVVGSFVLVATVNILKLIQVFVTN